MLWRMLIFIGVCKIELRLPESGGVGELSEQNRELSTVRERGQRIGMNGEETRRQERTSGENLLWAHGKKLRVGVVVSESR